MDSSALPDLPLNGSALANMAFVLLGVFCNSVWDDGHLADEHEERPGPDHDHDCQSRLESQGAAGEKLIRINI